MHAQQRDKVIVLPVGRSVCLSVCLFVCLSAPSHDFERNRLAYGLYLLYMSQKLKTISLHLPHKRECTSRSREKHLFWALLKLSFNIVDLYLERLYFRPACQLIAHGVSALRAPLVIGKHKKAKKRHHIECTWLFDNFLYLQ